MNDDDTLFDWDDEQDSNSDQSTDENEINAPGWNILIVDDEPEVHKITKLALANVTFKEKSIAFHSAYTGAEAVEYMRNHPDTAIILLDVVMEHDHAGLETAQKIRTELNNRATRIILRTGQPGQAPERDVITQYDINDYKAKTELTASKLFTTIIASLRSYHDILRIEANRHGLEKIVRASASVFALQSFQDFFGGLLTQMSSIFSLHGDAYLVEVEDDQVRVLCSSLEAETTHSEPANAIAIELPENLSDLAREVTLTDKSQFRETICACLIPDTAPPMVLAYSTQTEGLETEFVKLFAQNIGAAIRNMKLHDNLKEFNRSLERFLPREALTFLKKSNVTELNLGDYTEGEFSSFFLDIRRFTALAETMEPRDALNFINSFLSEIAPIVSAHYGVIDKYLGDGFMAVFGRPEVARTDAIECAVEILLSLSAYNQAHRAKSETLPRHRRTRQSIEIGIGIQSGPLIMGAVGHQGRIDFTIIGDVVNSASRIQHLNKFFGTSILVHDNMVEAIPESYAYRYIGAISVKGKREPLRIWEIFEADDSEQRNLKSQTQNMLDEAIDLIDSNETELARPILEKIINLNPKDQVVLYYLNMIPASGSVPHLKDNRNSGPHKF